jgi:hypothetical protein
VTTNCGSRSNQPQLQPHRFDAVIIFPRAACHLRDRAQARRLRQVRRKKLSLEARRSGIRISEGLDALLGAAVQQIGGVPHSLRDSLPVSLQPGEDQCSVIAKLLRQFSALLLRVHAASSAAMA